MVFIRNFLHRNLGQCKYNLWWISKHEPHARTSQGHIESTSPKSKFYAYWLFHSSPPLLFLWIFFAIINGSSGGWAVLQDLQASWSLHMSGRFKHHRSMMYGFQSFSYLLKYIGTELTADQTIWHMQIYDSSHTSRLALGRYHMAPGNFEELRKQVQDLGEIKRILREENIENHTWFINPS